MNDLEPTRHARYNTSYPALGTHEFWGDNVITQGHVDYCAAYGHAPAYAADTRPGMEYAGYCPRCGVDIQASTPALMDEWELALLSPAPASEPTGQTPADYAAERATVAAYARVVALDSSSNL